MVLDIGGVPRAARLLARAFAADPVLLYYLASPARRRLALSAFFRVALYEVLPQRSVFGVLEDDELVGVAAWLPPLAAPASTHARVWASRVMLRALFPVAAGKLLAGFAGLSPLHPAEPHWYLPFVGIEPARQRQGLGARLLAPVLKKADTDGILCYLETPFRETHRFYQRLGFEITSESRPFEAPVSIWAMLRPPAAKT